MVLCGLVGVSAIAWLYLLTGAGMAMDQMDMGGGQMMLMAPAWSPRYVALMFLMWTIMMVAMMLPSVAPSILLATNCDDQHPDSVSGVPAAACFAAGYFLVWTGFSVAATLLQWALDRAGLLSEAMASRCAMMGAGILLVAGFYQLTPMKQSFLRDCRAPLYALRVWKAPRAAFGTGVRVGLRCLGCCWALMGLMFVVGLMNVVRTAGLALFVLLEKTLSQYSSVSRLAGVLLIGWGCFTLATTFSQSVMH